VGLHAHLQVLAGGAPRGVRNGLALEVSDEAACVLVALEAVDLFLPLEDAIAVLGPGSHGAPRDVVLVAYLQLGARLHGVAVNYGARTR